VGYQHLQDQIVLAVNGQPIHNMQDVFRVVDESGGLERLTVESMGVDLVLEKKGLNQADAQLAANYGIPELRNQKKAPPALPPAP
jgi:hypothetical protein